MMTELEKIKRREAHNVALAMVRFGQLMNARKWTAAYDAADDVEICLALTGAAPPFEHQSASVTRIHPEISEVAQ